MIVFQLNWFIDPTPTTLPTWLMILGLEALTLAAVFKAFGGRVGHRATVIGGTCLGLGYFFTALSIISSNYDSYALYLLVLFRTIEGAAAARFYRKVVHVFRNQSLPGSRFKSRIVHMMVIYFVMLTGVGLAIASFNSSTSWYPQVTVIYTITMTIITGLGVWWRVSQLRGRYALPVLLGFVVSVTGAHMFDYGGVPKEIFVSLMGNVGFTAGFWLFILAWAVNLGILSNR